MNEVREVPVSSSVATRLSSLIGVLIVVLAFSTFIAILFMPKSEGVSDTVIQQIITIVQGVLAGYIGWQYGSSQSNAKAADTIAAQSAALAISAPPTPVVTTTTTAADPGSSTTTRTATGAAVDTPSPDPEIDSLRRPTH